MVAYEHGTIMRSCINAQHQINKNGKTLKK